MRHLGWIVTASLTALGLGAVLWWVLRDASLADRSAAYWTMIVGAVTNTSCAVLGCYLVLRRLSLLGDAISHAVLPGIVVAYLFSGQTTVVPLLLGAMAMGLLTALLTQTLHSLGRVAEDSSMGVVFTSLFAAGVLLLSQFAREVHLDPSCFLYGQIEFAPLDRILFLGFEVPRVMKTLMPALGVTLLLVTFCWKELKIVSFDPALATAMGISAVVIHYLLMAMVAAVTVAAFESVGSILVVAMLIVPAATAHLLTERLFTMMLCAVAVGILSSVLGYAGAVYLNTSVAGMMAVAAGGQFLVVVMLAPRHGLVSKALDTLLLALRVVGEDTIATLYRGEESRTTPASEPAFSRNEAVRAGGGGLAARMALLRLWQQGSVRFMPHGQVALTEQGRHAGRSLVRAHRLWESFLTENFDLPLDHLHEPAERIEHYIGPQLQQRLADELKQPSKDPHGRDIPENLAAATVASQGKKKRKSKSKGAGSKGSEPRKRDSDDLAE
jgi:ABC-type Mn2+/Zn2+ transport system permease subunit/Mn-dependent DtxR family transcriptional regulator